MPLTATTPAGPSVSIGIVQSPERGQSLVLAANDAAGI
jgi:hypothetical protein